LLVDLQACISVALESAARISSPSPIAPSKNRPLRWREERLASGRPATDSSR